MSKKKNYGKRDTLKEFIHDPNASKKEPYARIYPSLINHPKFMGLSMHAQTLYFRLAVKALGDSGYYRECTYQNAEMKKCFRPETFRKARDELLRNGFIQIQLIRTPGAKNKYRLSNNWYLYPGEVPKENQYY